jgi:hypothetical protein
MAGLVPRRFLTATLSADELRRRCAGRLWAVAQVYQVAKNVERFIAHRIKRRFLGAVAAEDI